MTHANAPSPLRRPISAINPMFIVTGLEDIGVTPKAALDEWKSIPDDLKPYSVVCYDGKGQHLSREVMEAFVSSCQEAGAWCIIQCNSLPLFDPGHSITDPDGSIADTVLFPNYSRFIGYTWCEMCWNGLQWNRGMKAQLEVAAKHGGYLLWADCCLLDIAGANNEFVTDCRRYKDNMIVLDKKTTIGNGHYWNTATALGLWLSGIAGNWGVSSDGFLWGHYNGNTCQGPEEKHPGTYLALQLLNGLVEGATVFLKFEVADSGIFRNCQYPLWRKIIQSEMTPTLADVKSWLKVGHIYEGKARESEVMGGLYNSGFWFPQTGRYHIVPVLSPLAQASDISFCEPVTADQFGSDETKRAFYNQRYPGDGESGTSWIRQFPRKGIYVIANPNDTNQSSRESTFFLPLRRNSCESLSGTLQSYTFATVEESPGCIQVQMCNYMGNCDLPRSNVTSFVLKGVNEPSEPGVTISGQIGYTKAWNAQTREYTLSVISNGTVHVTLRTSGGPRPG